MHTNVTKYRFVNMIFRFLILFIFLTNFAQASLYSADEENHEQQCQATSSSKVFAPVPYRPPSPHNMAEKLAEMEEAAQELTKAIQKTQAQVAILQAEQEQRALKERASRVKTLKDQESHFIETEDLRYTYHPRCGLEIAWFLLHEYDLLFHNVMDTDPFFNPYLHQYMINPKYVELAQVKIANAFTTIGISREVCSAFFSIQDCVKLDDHPESPHRFQRYTLAPGIEIPALLREVLNPKNQQAWHDYAIRLSADVNAAMQKCFRPRFSHLFCYDIVIHS